MDRDPIDKYGLEKLAGLAVGIPIGAVLGPILFVPLGLTIPAAASIGCGIGALTGYLLVTLFVRMQKRRIDREIAAAALAVRVEAGLPDTIRIRVKDAHVTLEGEVAYEAQRTEAGRVIETIPGVKGITNRIRTAPPVAA